MIAHTRKATRGTRAYPNAQPFVRELAGRAHLFAHNGDLPGIFKSNAFQADRFNPIGETDSELAFCVLLDQMAAIWTVPNATPTLRQRFLIVSSFAGQLRKLGPANFLYSDGDMLFAHGHRRKHADTGKIEAPGLVSVQRQCQQRHNRLGSQWPFHPWRQSTSGAVRERSLDERAVGAACRRRVGCRLWWSVRCTATGRRKSRILRGVPSSLDRAGP